MRIELGYPGKSAERALLKGRDRREILANTEATISAERLMEIQQQVTQVHVADALLDYLQDLLDFSRQSPLYSNGLSPRAGLAVLHCARAWALMEGHPQVLPEDVQAILPSVVGHRLNPSREQGDVDSATLISDFLGAVPIP
jgi:MoxR-like ATPase